MANLVCGKKLTTLLISFSVTLKKLIKQGE
jgi:hypothetical protein